MGRKADPLSDPAPLIRRVYAYVAYRIGDGPEAEDVSSEVFERALRYRWSYNPDKAAPITWLMAIARRVLADRGGGDETLVAGDAIDRADPLDVEGESVQRLDLQAAVAQLSERDRELIGLRYGADLTAAQIAELLESEPHAVEVSLSRAVSRLRSFATVWAPTCEVSDAGPVYEGTQAIRRGTMRRFWDNGQDGGDIEARLRAERPEPSKELVDRITGQFADGRQRRELSKTRRRSPWSSPRWC